MKSGYKTTEFWLTLLAILLGAFVASGLLPTEHVAIKVAGMVTTVLAALGYTLGRVSAKNTEVGYYDAPVQPLQPEEEEGREEE